MNVFGTVNKFLLGGLVAGTMVFTGCLTDEAKEETPAEVHTQFGAETTIPAGAQAATLGSVLDLDALKALTSAEANAAQASIDLVFMYYGGAFHADNAVAAKAAGVANNINLTNSYSDTQIKNCEIVKVSTKPADQEAAKKAFTDGPKITGSPIVGGEIFIVKTTGGKLALVTVGTIVGTDNKANGNFAVTLSTITI